jgi:hypothetical protein
VTDGLLCMFSLSVCGVTRTLEGLFSKMDRL